MNSPIPSEEAIFQTALEMSVSDRVAYLEQACGDDAGLRQRVEQLIAAHEGAADFMKPGPTDRLELDSTVLKSRHEMPSDRIGRYKLLQEIGEGGFGTVWMAEQEQPVRRRVALKIIKLGMDTCEVIARFEAERQALAMMDHPNIAKVFDAGATPTGRPFFVMELVRGVPITKFCDDEKLPMAQRLALFVQVCHAIQHAHQKGIIHRDIKPSNILVTPGDDGKPVPKVIDFGIAKAMNCTLTDKTLFTQFEQMLGTPAYMSPEQAGTGPMDIDTRSDVYALGVLLYEMLTGRPPFDPKALMKSGMDEMRRVIREDEPPKPSTCLSTMQGAQLTSLAQSRHTEAPKLVSTMKGELDWIVMKALEKNRTRRYDTANGFAMDVGRYLRDEAVIARPPSTVYLLQKLVRRHKTVFTAASAVLLVLIAGIAVSCWQALRATRAERAAEEERAKAVTDRDRARNAEQQANEQRQLAETERGVAGEERIKAVTERDRARAAEEEAKDQRKKAETARQETEHNLYVASMNLAQGAWEAANMSRLRALLDETRTYPNRGFEWYYWQRQTHLELRTLRGHQNQVRSVAFSPDGRRIVTCGDDKIAKVWDAETGRDLFTLKGHSETLTSAAFSPDGRRVVTGSEDETAKVWDAENGRELLTLKGHKGSGIPSEIYSENGQTMASVKGNTGAVMSVAFAPDGGRILTGSWDRTAKVWDAKNGRELLTLKGHTNMVKSVAFSPDGRRMATGSPDMTTKLWDVETGRELLTLKTAGLVWSLVFSPDGRRMVGGIMDKTAKVWDVETGRELLILKGHNGAVQSVAFSPDGRRIVTGGEDEMAKLWDAETGRELLTLKGHASNVVAVAFSPDGRRVVTGSEDKTARVWDVENGRELLTLKGHDLFVSSVAFSPDGRRIITGSWDQTAKLWDAENGRELLTLKGHNDYIWSVAFSSDGRRIVTGSGDKTAKVWMAASPEEVEGWREEEQSAAP